MNSNLKHHDRENIHGLTHLAARLEQDIQRLEAYCANIIDAQDSFSREETLQRFSTMIEKRRELLALVALQLKARMLA